ncbi:MAG: hypothetical protein IKV30_03800 [Clostridia bacterium]|nr:hypothetical protein [Clostridia bacterium]
MNNLVLSSNVITIDVDLLMKYVCTTVYILVGIALIVLLIKAIKVVGNVNKLLKDNQENITGTINNLPAITDNVKDITDTVKEVGDSVKGVANSACSAVTSVADTVGNFSVTVNKAANKTSLVSSVISFLTMAKPYIVRAVKRSRRQSRKAAEE